MTNPFAPLVFDPPHRTLARRVGRTLRELPEAERPRERLALRGAGGLNSAELIAIVWGTGARGMSAVDLAEEAVARHDGLTGLARASDAELAAIPGIGPSGRPS